MDLFKISGLWINKDKNGNQYLSGQWGSNIKLIIFKNTKKRPDSKDPDYNVFLAPIEPKPKEEKKEDHSDF